MIGNKVWLLVGLLIGVGGVLVASQVWSPAPVTGLVSLPASGSSSDSFIYFDTPTSSGYFDPNHHSIPTKMSLQGKVTDFNGNLVDDANLGVRVTDQNNCSMGVFYANTYYNEIQDGFFNVLLGQDGPELRLNFNQDYYICVYVNNDLMGGGPQVFRGGQGEVHSDALFDGNATTPLDVNYLHVNNDLSVDGSINMGCGQIYWDDPNQTLTIQVSC